MLNDYKEMWKGIWTLSYLPFYVARDYYVVFWNVTKENEVPSIFLRMCWFMHTLEY